MSEGSKVDSAGELSDVDNENCSSSSGSGGGGGSSGETKKTCVDCGTFKTPLWRGGPAGPKSLCNACGIKSRKKRQAALGIKPEKKIRKSNSSDSDLSSLDHHRNDKSKIKNDDDDHKACSSKSGGGGASSSSSCSKRVSKFLDLGLEVPVMKRSSVEKKRLWKKLGEEERAAVLLMALSCGSVYA